MKSFIVLVGVCAAFVLAVMILPAQASEGELGASAGKPTPLAEDAVITSKEPGNGNGNGNNDDDDDKPKKSKKKPQDDDDDQGNNNNSVSTGA